MVVITALNALEEEVVIQRIKKRARDNCKTELQNLVNCTRDKTFSMFYKCKGLNALALKCTSQYTLDEDFKKEFEVEREKKIQYLKENGKYPII